MLEYTIVYNRYATAAPLFYWSNEDLHDYVESFLFQPYCFLDGAGNHFNQYGFNHITLVVL